MSEQRARRRLVAALATIAVSMAAVAAPAAHLAPAPPLEAPPQMAGKRPANLDEHFASLPLARPQSSQDSAPRQTPEEIRVLAGRLAESARPGPEHERLARMAGAWDIEIKMWPRPGAEPLVMRGTVEAETILGGRFLVQTADKDEMHTRGGAPFKMVETVQRRSR